MTPLSPGFCLIPLACAALVVATSLAARSGRVAPLRDLGVGWREVRWAWLFAALLAAIAATVAGGIFGAGAGVLVAYCLATSVLALASLCGGDVAARADALLARTPLPTWARRALPAAVVLLLATALGCLALESPYNPGWFAIAPRYALLEGAVAGLVLLALLLLAQGSGGGPAAGVLALAGIGVAQFYVKTFKNAAILPGDLSALGTAAAVSGGYSYVFSASVVVGLLFAEAGVFLCSLLRPPAPCHRARSVAGHLGAAACSLAALAALVTVPSYQALYGISTNQLFWNSISYCERQGFLTTFVIVGQEMPIRQPAGYSEQGAAELEAAYAARYDAGAGQGAAAARRQFADERPSVVCVMDETFSDLSTYGALAEDTGYPGPRLFREGLTDAVWKGDLTVSVVGGGTCNTEFEFLTGVPLSCVGDGKYPYSLYDLSDAPSVAREFKALGYQTTALHPNWASNWDRDSVYPALGFDTFLSYDTGTFDGDPWYHNGVSDEATYGHVLELLESGDAPQFVFDVTMQNHGGYDTGNIPEADRLHYAASRLGTDDNAQLNEYLACINESDRALGAFLDELRGLDRPVVVVFFGDHQPSLAPAIDDAYYPDEADAMAHAQRQRQTSYLVWANYDMAGVAQDSPAAAVSVDDLASLALGSVGAPLSDYERAKLALRQDVLADNTAGYLGADGRWYELDDADSPYAGAYGDLTQMAYLEFGSKVR